GLLVRVDRVLDLADARHLLVAPGARRLRALGPEDRRVEAERALQRAELLQPPLALLEAVLHRLRDVRVLVLDPVDRRLRVEADPVGVLDLLDDRGGLGLLLLAVEERDLDRLGADRLLDALDGEAGRRPVARGALEVEDAGAARVPILAPLQRP